MGRWGEGREGKGGEGDDEVDDEVDDEAEADFRGGSSIMGRLGRGWIEGISLKGIA